jgi:alpha-beta hydrolase superfamily lysophospholipase
MRVPRRTAVAFIALAGLAFLLHSQLPAIGAGALLHPYRRIPDVPVPRSCVDQVLEGAGVKLAGWRCDASGTRRGAVVYLHGVGDNRASGVGIIQRFVSRGLDVVAYDSRAHGGSGGDACTYGFFEKEDLKLVIDTLEAGPIVLLGTSLGAAVALQHAGRDARVSAVVAAETFSDLRTAAEERAPFLFANSAVDQSFALAEQQATFRIHDVSPVRAAALISIPVLLVHGDADRETPPAHSQRVYDALRGPKKLILVPGAAHNASLRGEVWSEIERWVDSVLEDALPQREASPAGRGEA